MDFLDWLTEIFRLYGYYFLFFATLLENVPFVGMFLPGEVIVLAAGFFAAQGQLDVAAVIVVACFGAMSGSSLSYFLGRKGGRQLIEAIAVKFRVDPSKLDNADKYFDSHGALTVFIGRYLTGVKAFFPALAGAHKMKFHTFFLFGAIAIISWTVLAALLGYFFGSNWDQLTRIIRMGGWFVAAIVVLVGIVIWRRLRSNDL